MNTNEIDKVYIGSNEVTKLYLGSTLVWEKPAPPGEDRIVAINFTDTPYTQAPSPWNNIDYSNIAGTGANLMDTTTAPTTISLASISNVDGASNETYSGTLPIPEIYASDWWGDLNSNSIQLNMTGFDAGKKYKIKIIGSTLSSGLTKYNLVNNEATAIPMGSSFPNSADLTSDTNYVVLEAEGQTSYTIYGWRVADQYKSLIAVVIEETSAEPKELVSIEIQPTVNEIPEGGTQQYSAVGTFSDSSTSTLTSGVWGSSNPSIVSINSTGLATGVSVGTADLTYTVDSIVGSLEVDIVESEGRIFSVGTGSGNLTIDGSDNTKPWYPLQAGDTFEIQGGTYGTITTVNLSSQSVVKNKDNQTVTASFFYINSPQTDVRYKFDGNGSVDKGLVLIMESQDTMHIDRAGIGGLEDIHITGIKYSILNTTPDGGIFLRHSQNATTPYNNGLGVVSLRNVTIENIEFDLTAKSSFSPWYLMSFNRGDLSASVDNNFIDGLTIRNVRASGQCYCANVVEVKNCQNVLIDDFYFDSLNNDWTDNPPHARIILIQGHGIIQNCYMRDGMGNVGVIWGYNRLANNSPSIIRNCISYNSFRYSTAEIQGFSNLIVSGVSKAPHYKMMGLTADTLDTGNYFSGCAGDIYPLQGGTFEAINSVSINGHSNSSGQNNPFNNMAGAGTISNNAVYADRLLAGVEDVTYVPEVGSPLIGAGISDEDFTEDYYGNARPNPPSIGAAEPV